MMTDQVEELRKQVDDLRVMIDAIDGALCNYINGCCDPYEPVSQWDEESKRGFSKLCDAYNQWHKDHKEVGKISQDFYCGMGRQIHDLSRKLDSAEMTIANMQRAAVTQDKRGAS